MLVHKTSRAWKLHETFLLPHLSLCWASGCSGCSYAAWGATLGGTATGGWAGWGSYTSHLTRNHHQLLRGFFFKKSLVFHLIYLNVGILISLLQLYSELQLLWNPASTNNLQDLLSTGGQRSFIAAANKQSNKDTVNITLEAVLILLEVMPHLLHSHLFLNLLTAEWL